MAHPPRPVAYEINERGCFVCTSHSLNEGYPQVGRKIDGRVRVERLHRVIYRQQVGPIPEGQLVRHSCDDTRCINPRHLILGTHADNMRDAAERGRKRRGAAAPRAKLTETQAFQLLRAPHGSVGRLAAEFGVCRVTASNVRTGKTFRHLQEAH